MATDALQQLRYLYTTYLAQADDLNAGHNRYASMLKWLFGMSRNPGESELNPRFYESVDACLKEFEAESYTSEQALEVVRFVLEFSTDKEEHPVAGMTFAATQGLLTPLVSALPCAEAAQLADRYAAHYPRHKRFPVQETLLKALTVRGKAAE